MDSKKMIKKGGSLLIIGSLIFLPGCGLFSSKKDSDSAAPMAASAPIETAAIADGSEVIVTMNGKPLVTKNMLDKEKKKLLESNPQLQAMIALMDEKQLDRNLADGMTSREIIRKYVADNNIASSDKYKKDYETVLGQVKDALNTRYFMEAFTVSVTDNELKKFYDENKDNIPNLLVSRGGVETMAIPFSNEMQAKEFASKVRANKNNIMATAKEVGVASRVKDFKLVNDQSVGIEPELRDKVMEIKSPSVQNFKVGKDYWVVVANKLEKPQYRALDQVKDELRQLLEKDKTMKRFEEEVARLKGEYRIEMNNDFFGAQVDNPQSVQALGEESDAKPAPVKAVQTEDKKPAAAKTSVA